MSESISQVRTEVPSCGATDQELRDQRRRQARLAPGIAGSRREDGAVVVEFTPDFDGPALEELIEVERGCCPFFRFDFDEANRRLRVSVDDEAHVPALDALAGLLAPTGA
jgi:hypothetical protein